MEQKEPFDQSNGEIHHFQLVNAAGDVPFSISVLLHYNTKDLQNAPLSPIGAEDIIQFHDALKHFDGNFIKAFSS